MGKIVIEGVGGEVNEVDDHGFFIGRLAVVQSVLKLLNIFVSILLKKNLASRFII